MGFSESSFRCLAAHGSLRRGSRILDFGSQDIYGAIPVAVIREFSEACGLASLDDDSLIALSGSGVKIGPLFAALGLQYIAFDMYEAEYTKRFDLNFDSLTNSESGTFDVVMNLGTSEHVANQFNVFKVMHDALRPGGVALNFVPFYGLCDHGLFNYNPKFFRSLIANNGYEALFVSFSSLFESKITDSFQNIDAADNGAAWEGKYLGGALMMLIWKKHEHRKFIPPTDFAAEALEPGSHIPSINELLAKPTPSKRRLRDAVLDTVINWTRR